MLFNEQMQHLPCVNLTCTILRFVLVLGETKTKLVFGFAMVF